MRTLLLAALALSPTVALRAQDDAPEFDRARFEAQLRYKQGTITLRNGLATLRVPPAFRYLDPAQSERLLVEAWGNPPGNKTLGMLVPADVSPLADHGWAVVITYDQDGHVKDDDAESIDYTKLLRDMQRDTRAANKDRIKAGYAPVELLGWVSTPRYHAATHKLYWAKELKFGDEPVNTLNYNIRVLGRRGVLVLNAVASMDQFVDVERRMGDVLTFVDFNDGHRYADFNAATDDVAKYGLAALVAGGLAAKTGFFKGLLVALLAAKKLLVAAVIAVFAGVSKLFKRKQQPAPAVSRG